MNRREYLGLAALGGGAALAGAAAIAGRGSKNRAGDAFDRTGGSQSETLASPAILSNAREFRMVTTWPKGLPGLGQAAERVARTVGALSEGRLKIRVYADGELVKALECFDAVAAGSADMYHGAEYYWTGKVKGFAFFTAVPFGMTATEIMGWVREGGGQALWEELSGQFNVIAFHAANTGHQMGGWFRREIRSIDDWRGLKMRIPGLAGEVVRRLGGSAVVIPGADIFEALTNGTIDATEWVGPWNDEALGFHRAAPLYYGPCFHEPGAALALGMNRKVWDSLSSGDRAIFRAACAECNDWSLGAFTYNNGAALQRLVTTGGVTLRSFPDDVMLAARKASAEVLEAAAAADPLSRRIHESYKAALGTMRRWSEIGDGAYLRARGLP